MNKKIEKKTVDKDAKKVEVKKKHFIKKKEKNEKKYYFWYCLCQFYL